MRRPWKVFPAPAFAGERFQQVDRRVRMRVEERWYASGEPLRTGGRDVDDLQISLALRSSF